MIADAKNGEEYNFDYMFENVKGFINNSDFAMGTIETNFVEGQYKGTGKYNSPIEFLSAVKNSGINIMSLAHNQ